MGAFGLPAGGWVPKNAPARLLRDLFEPGPARDRQIYASSPLTVAVVLAALAAAGAAASVEAEDTAIRDPLLRDDRWRGIDVDDA